MKLPGKLPEIFSREIKIKRPNFGIVDSMRFLRYVAVRLQEDRCTQMAASLTFTTLLSLVPLLTIALTLFSAFPVFGEYSTHFKEFILSNMAPETGGRIITSYMQQFADSASRLTAVGIVLLAVTAMLLMLTIDNAFNKIWRVSRPRSLLQRVLVYWAVITLAPLLIGGSLSLTSWLVGFSSGYARGMNSFGMDVLKFIPLLMTTAAFTLLFRVVPNRFVPMRHAILGGLIAAVTFESMNRAFAFYISYFPTYKLVYGAFASVPIFLMWIYFSWLTVLFGAIITASLSHWRSTHALRLDQAARLYYAVSILKLMHKGLEKGEVQTLLALSRHLHIGYDDIERILEKLVQARIVGKLADHGWSMIRTPERVTLGELLKLFLLDAATLPKHGGDGDIKSWFLALERGMHEPSDMTLNDLWNKAA
ncbi:MAG: YihY family inner membrane protein [Gammaproteobacteria bacterium]|nr:YihY family inner membrane protein [Gammaproteobacteria bacterium]MBU1968538.1 YihY family inner membrane protein [Gammaproteobacteria bacterium]